MTRSHDPSWPGRPLLAGAALALGVPYLGYVMLYVPPQGFETAFTTPGYFAWFVGQVLLLGAITVAGLRRGERQSARGLAGWLAILLGAMIADDLWRKWVIGPGYRLFPLGQRDQPLLGLVYHWRAAGEAALLLLIMAAAALGSEPARRGWWASRLGLILVSAAVPVAALEVALRAGWINPPYTAYRGGAEVFRPNYLLGWSNVPRASTEHFSTDFRVAVRINAHGERGPDIAYERTPGVSRVLVLGDSFAFGAGVEQDRTFSAQLAAMQPATEVINSGVTGYSLDQEWLYLQHEGLRYAPDTVVLAIFTGNDFGELGVLASYGFPRPYFTLEQGRLLLHPLGLADGSRYEEDPRPFSFRRLSYAAQLVDRVIALRHYSRLAQVAPPAPPPAQPATSGEWLDAATYAEPPATAGLASALLAAIGETCERAGCRLVVMLIPAPETVAGPPGEGDEAGYRRACEFVAARQMAQALGLPVVDMLDLLAAHSAAGEPMYHPHDGHWTAAAHALAAEALSEDLDRRSPAGRRDSQAR